MKQKSLLRSLLLLFSLIVGVGSAWAADVTDVLNQTLTGVTGTSYSSWSDKTSVSEAVYAGNSAGGNSSIQLRSSNNNSGIVTTASGGKVKTITVTWNSNTQSGRTLNVYGKNSAYSGAADLYDTSKQGTLLGTIVYGTSTELTVTGDYEYIGFRSASGAMYLTSVSIVWETGGSTLTESDFALTGAPVALSFDLNNSSAQTISYTTSSTGAVTVSESDYVTITVDESNKKITVTPKAVTPSARTITVNQAATDTYAAGSATFTVSITAKHAVKFSVNGVITTTDEVNEGAAIVFPADPEDIAGKSFVGWTATAIDGTTNNAPTFVTSATMGTADVTYYAVFANVTKGNHKNVVDEITASDLTATSTTYTDFSDVEITSAAKYAGNSAKDDSGNIQMRSKNSNSGIVSTTSGGRLKSVNITVGSGSNTIDVYGSNTAYDSAGNLYATGSNSKQGTKLGSVSATGTITVTEDYAYVGIRSNNGAIYLSSISITWETGTPDTYSNYCTTVPAPESVSATIASSGYTTFCSPYDLSFESVPNLEAAYVVTTSTAETATLKKVTAVPAETGVILKGTKGTTVTIPVAEYTGEAISNILVGTLTATPVETETVYVVSGGEFKLFAGTEIPAGKAYLPADKIGGNAPSLSFDFGGETTSINSLTPALSQEEGVYYDLSGRRVAQPTKGLYILNGKKVLVP